MVLTHYKSVASCSEQVGLGTRKDDPSNQYVTRGLEQINGHTSENSSIKKMVSSKYFMIQWFTISPLMKHISVKRTDEWIFTCKA